MLSRADTDAFNRWDAFQRRIQRCLLGRIRMAMDVGSVGEDALPEDLSKAFGQLLLEAAQDPMFVAECIALPSENYLADQFDHDTPVEWIHHERARLRQQLAEEWESTLQLIYQSHAQDGVYRFESRAAGQRQLRRQVLSYL
ncbi:MAG: hypothetical protein B7X28_09195, partial [Halothiobacillus sp. 13-55-253]